MAARRTIAQAYRLAPFIIVSSKSGASDEPVLRSTSLQIYVLYVAIAQIKRTSSCSCNTRCITLTIHYVRRKELFSFLAVRRTRMIFKLAEIFFPT